jgi:hypothetical protein
MKNKTFGDLIRFAVFIVCLCSATHAADKARPGSVDAEKLITEAINARDKLAGYVAEWVDESNGYSHKKTIYSKRLDDGNHLVKIVTVTKSLSGGKASVSQRIRNRGSGVWEVFGSMIFYRPKGVLATDYKLTGHLPIGHGIARYVKSESSNDGYVEFNGMHCLRLRQKLPDDVIEAICKIAQGEKIVFNKKTSKLSQGLVDTINEIKQAEAKGINIAYEYLVDQKSGAVVCFRRIQADGNSTTQFSYISFAVNDKLDDSFFDVPRQMEKSKDRQNSTGPSVQEKASADFAD